MYSTLTRMWSKRNSHSSLVGRQDSAATSLAQTVKNPPAMQKTWVQFLGWKEPPEKGMATLSSILACRNSMDRGAWGYKESDMTEPLSLSYWKTVWRFLKKLNVLLPYDPAVLHFDIYSKELKTYIHTKSCTQMFIAVLFTIAKTCKQPRHPQ